MTTSNPFVFKKPVENPEFLLGRRLIFPWIEEKLVLENQNQAVAISGRPGLGRTSILRNLSLLPTRSSRIILQIDARDLHEASSSESTWALVKSFNQSLRARKIPHPNIEKPSFVLQPERVFIKSFWEPLLQSKEISSVLLVIDNMELLTSELNTGQDLRRKREFLWSLVKRYENIQMLVSLQGRPELYSPDSVAPFSFSANYQLQFLTREQTSILLNKTEQYTIAEYVCDYIFRLTSGHPADVQRLAYQIFERSIETGYSFITIADVLAILSADLRGGDFYQPVYGRREETKLVYSPQLDNFEFVDDGQQS